MQMHASVTQKQEWLGFYRDVSKRNSGTDAVAIPSVYN